MKSPWSYLPVASGMLVLVLSLAVAVMTVTSKKGVSQNVATKAAEETASLALSPAAGDYVLDTKTAYPVGIIVDSAGKTTDGVDIIISFDPKKVQVLDTKVTTTTLFEEFPVNQVDNTLGKIKISALTFNAKPVTGVVGTFRFRPKTTGQVNFSFDYTAGSTVDSNIAEHSSAKDILSRVENGSYTFK